MRSVFRLTGKRVPAAFVLAFLPAASMWSCGGEAPPPASPAPQPTASVAPTAEELPLPPAGPRLVGLSDEDASALDRSVSPCTDFFQFACGGWAENTQIPDDEASWMRSFSVIRERNETLLKTILEDYAAGRNTQEPYAKKLGDMYGACMDESAIDKAGIKPLLPELRAIAALKDKTGIAKLVAKLHARGLPVLFAIGAQQDFEDSTRMIGAIDQAGLGMPDRDYYLKADGKFPELRNKYLAHVTAMLQLAGDKHPEASAKAVLELETELARAQMSKEDRRDPKKIYHLTQKADLAKVTPEFPWDVYLAGLPLGEAKLFNVAQTDYLKTVGSLLSSSKIALDSWKAYLEWHLLHASASALSTPYVEENFRWAQTLTGQAKLPPRWKRCTRKVDGALGEALAQPFVKKTLGAEGKATVKEMVLAIEGEMKKNLDALTWMDPKTKTLAHEKLSTIANQIAYPDRWRNYDAVAISRGNHYENLVAADVFDQKRQLAKIGKPVDRTEWFMTPPAVNAYYDPSMNQMVFPAGILQPPFYGNQQSLAANFGGIGMVMGHELTHGFDDEGRQFDAHGNLKEWWSEATNSEFERRASCVEKQFDGYEVLGEKVNGKLTLGENIADLGGVKLSLAALMSYSAKKAQPVDTTPGAATAEQRFFLGYAQSWCGKYRDEMMRVLVATNPHSPPQFRVNGPLSNLPEFAKAFGCSAGHPMAPKNACTVW